jgi:hypothetical protein
MYFYLGPRILLFPFFTAFLYTWCIAVKLNNFPLQLLLPLPQKVPLKALTELPREKWVISRPLFLLKFAGE